MKEGDFDDIIYRAFARAEKQRLSKRHERDGGKDCLSDETICYYLESLLSDAEREKVEEHLFDCPFCLEAVIDVCKSEELERAEILREMEKKESKIKAKTALGEVMDAVIKPLKISLAWVGGHLTVKETDAEFIPFWNDLKPVLVRGGSNKKALSIPPFSKTYGDYKVKARILEEEEGKCAVQLKVFPLSEKREGARIKAELWKADRIQRSFPLVNDAILFQGISCGDYIIKIWESGHLIAEIAIKINETGCI